MFATAAREGASRKWIGDPHTNSRLPPHCAKRWQAICPCATRRDRFPFSALLRCFFRRLRPLFDSARGIFGQRRLHKTTLLHPRSPHAHTMLTPSYALDLGSHKSLGPLCCLLFGLWIVEVRSSFTDKIEQVLGCVFLITFTTTL